MKRLFGLIVLGFTFAAIHAAHAQSLDGFQVGGDIKAALASHAAPAASGKLGDADVYRWALDNGNSTSVTADAKGRIVFVETDWGGDVGASATGIPGVTFGATTLAAIRKKFGSNGFSFKKHAMHMDANDIISVNAYHLKAVKSVVLVLVTTLPVAAVPEVDGKPQIDSGKGTLQAVTLADTAYLDQLWGAEKVSDPKEKPVGW